MYIPALATLEIRSRSSSFTVARPLRHFVPDDRLPRRLFSDPLVLEVGRFNHYGRSIL